jgi:hypothetical protein
MGSLFCIHLLLPADSPAGKSLRGRYAYLKQNIASKTQITHFLLAYSSPVLPSWQNVDPTQHILAC